MGTEPDWRKYEGEIARRLRARAAPDATITFDKNGRQRLSGRFSGTTRQVDVLVRGKFAGLPGEHLMVVECKHWSAEVGVGTVDAFVGFLLDVGVAFGVIVTSQGFTKAAERRAENQGAPAISVDVVAFDRLAEWRPKKPTIAWTVGTNTATFTATRDGKTFTETVDLDTARQLYREMYGREIDE